MKRLAIRIARDLICGLALLMVFILGITVMNIDLLTTPSPMWTDKPAVPTGEAAATWFCDIDQNTEIRVLDCIAQKPKDR